MKTIQAILDEFDKKFPKVECSAHERMSSSSCICSELEDINSENTEFKSFLRQALTQQLDELKGKVEGGRVESARKTSSKNADEYRAYCTGGEEMQNRILTIINSMK